MPIGDVLPIDEAGVVAFPQEPVRIRTLNDPRAGTAELPAAILVEERMREFGWDPQVSEIEPGRPNGVAVIEGGGGPGPTLMLEGHTDVVTEGDRRPGVSTRSPATSWTDSCGGGGART